MFEKRKLRKRFNQLCEKGHISSLIITEQPASNAAKALVQLEKYLRNPPVKFFAGEQIMIISCSSRSYHENGPRFLVEVLSSVVHVKAVITVEDSSSYFETLTNCFLDIGDVVDSNSLITVYQDPETGIQDFFKEFNDDSCYDIRVPTSGVIPVGETATIDLGFAVTFPKGHEIQLRPRSGLTKLKVIPQLGTIDNGYIGSVGVTIINFSDLPFEYNRGDRLCQMAVCPVKTDCEVEFSAGEPPETRRGSGGFGHTGIK